MLITLGIIGVVAAITLPVLIQNNKAAKLRTQFLKSYSVISQALRRMEADDISSDPRDYLNADYFYKNFKTYFTNVTDCRTNNKGNIAGCYYNGMTGYRELSNNSSVSYGAFNNAEFMLPDGTLIFLDDNPLVERAKGSAIYVDINGYNNKPNRLGYDFFAFEIIDGKLYAVGDKGTSAEDNKDDEFCTGKIAHGNYTGLTCASRAKSNSDYFKNVVRKYK